MSYAVLGLTSTTKAVFAECSRHLQICVRLCVDHKAGLCALVVDAIDQQKVPEVGKRAITLDN